MTFQSDPATELVFGNDPRRSPKYKGIIKESLYLEMGDGVKLAVDLVLPKDLAAGERLPTLLSQSRYWRSIELRAPFSWFLKPEVLDPDYKDFQPFFTSHGYALVLVDVRGTGASFGKWTHPWSPESVTDAANIVDWIISQPWSNGKIGGYGVSYLGTTAELLSVLCHPAVKAVLPMFNHPDAYRDIAFPGGIYNERFIKAWAHFDKMLDQNIVPSEFRWSGKLFVQGVNPVAGDLDRRLLKKAIEDHASNGEVHQLSQDINYRDDRPAGLKITLDDLAIHQYQAEIHQTETVSCGWGSWMDAGTADAVIRRFLSYENAKQGVIGAWEHGGRYQASPYQPGNLPANPNIKQQWSEMLRFFDAYLLDNVDGSEKEKVLFYYTMGEEKWKKTHTWPPPGIATQRWYLSTGHSLSTNKPSAETGSDSYTVDFEASTGVYNRWWELGALEFKTVDYPNRTEADNRLLTYTSSPIEADLEITGYPIVNLYISSTEQDGAFYIYLEDVHPDGRVTYLTEGQLRAIHRKISGSTPPYAFQVPYHTFRQEDAQPMLPGETTEIAFGLQPVSVLIQSGHRLRVSLAGHDHGTFVRIPSMGTPVLTLQRNRIHASFIDLPVLRRG